VAGRLQSLAGDEAAVRELAAPSFAHLLVGVGHVDPARVDVRIEPGDVDELWARRLAPFAANLRAGRRAPRRRQAVLSPPDPTWPAQAARLIARLVAVVGDPVVRIDHIGSTSVPGLPAKDLVDIQVVVADLDMGRRVARRAPEAGFVHVAGEWFGEDRNGDEHPEEVLVDADPGRPVNVNVRPLTGPVWREALRFRDWLRTHPDECDAYAAMKQALAGTTTDVDAYSTGKMPWIRAALRRAER